MPQILVGLILVAIALRAIVRLLEPKAAFFPTAGESVTPRDYGVAYEPLSVETSDGVRLHGWSLAAAAPRATILYFHGNGGNLSIWAPILAGLVRRGYSVVAFDYRGYGLSAGRPTERGLYRDVEATSKRFWTLSRTPGPVVYWGRSLGVVMAAYAATLRAPDGMILESGFASARSLLRTSPLAMLLPFATYRFPCAEFMKKCRAPAPVLVLHGDEDRVVPIRHGRELFEKIDGQKAFVTIRGGDHNDAVPADPEAYWSAIDEFVAHV